MITSISKMTQGAQLPNAASVAHDAMILAELEQLRSEQERLERLYPYLESKPELRASFRTAVAALNIRAERVDALLTPAHARKNVA